MKVSIIIFCLIMAHLLQAQPAITNPESKSLTLKERFQEMKAGGQTFNEYKVIKEYQLDRTWKIVSDTLNQNQAAMKNANTEITRLQNEISSKENFWKQKELAYNDLEFDGTHLTFLGISFGKKTFITIFLFIVGGLLLVIGLLALSMKSLSSTQREKADLINRISSEFEEYKHKALEKQTKLSRELQNERNRLSEMKKS